MSVTYSSKTMVIELNIIYSSSSLIFAKSYRLLSGAVRMHLESCIKQNGDSALPKSVDTRRRSPGM